MSKTILVGILLSIVFGLITYIASDSIIAAIAVLVITALYFVFVLNKRIEKHHIKIARFHEAYHFINNFVISLSIKGSVLASFENASRGASESFQDVVDSISQLNENEKILYLKKYFPFHSYHLFADIILLWCEEGGNILEMTNYLSNQLRNEEEYLSYCESLNKKTIVEFSILWIFTLGILASLRFALKDFYSMILAQKFFPFAVAGIFVLVIFSIEVLSRKMVTVELGGWKDERK